MKKLRLRKVSEIKEILHIDTPPDNEPSQINTTSTDEEIVEDYNENVS